MSGFSDHGYWSLQRRSLAWLSDCLWSHCAHSHHMVDSGTSLSSRSLLITVLSRPAAVWCGLGPVPPPGQAGQTGLAGQTPPENKMETWGPPGQSPHTGVALNTGAGGGGGFVTPWLLLMVSTHYYQGGR